ncbi:hemoglobin subunit theta-1 [Erinaceus europaeus]|uniref:Hemoglobin subunit theta-1 n=1 Tax=Erinaceus europaeus TaxID=9365 RepID=A0A1S3A241_ERIEU|nr:hemoglobin subunit theta-1 [Erinaceus europaeus]
MRPRGGEGRGGEGRGRAGGALGSAVMALSAGDEALVRALWRKMGSNVGVYTTEALERIVLAFPSTRIYFAPLDLSPGSMQLRAHGKKVAAALSVALGHLDDLPDALSALSDLHTRQLRVDPTSFQLLGHCLLLTLARHYPGDFSPAMHRALHRFLTHVAWALASPCG